MIMNSSYTVRRGLRRLGAACVILLAACGTEEAPAPLQPSGPVARIRFVNVITDPARLPVNAILEGLPFGVNLGYGGTTPSSLPAPSTANYAQILAGQRTLELVRTADPSVSVLTIPVTMAANEDRTVYAIGGGVLAAFQTTDDNTAPAAGQVKLRFVNLAPAAGAVDVFVTASGADLATATPAAAGLAPQTASSYVSMPAGTYEVRVVPAGTAPAARNGAVTLTIAATAFPALAGRTILIADAAAGGTPLRGFIYSDR
jgi:hypothetical protein